MQWRQPVARWRRKGEQKVWQVPWMEVDSKRVFSDVVFVCGAFVLTRNFIIRTSLDELCPNGKSNTCTQAHGTVKLQKGVCMYMYGLQQHNLTPKFDSTTTKNCARRTDDDAQVKFTRDKQQQHTRASTTPIFFFFSLFFSRHDCVNVTKKALFKRPNSHFFCSFLPVVFVFSLSSWLFYRYL